MPQRDDMFNQRRSIGGLTGGLTAAIAATQAKQERKIDKLYNKVVLEMQQDYKDYLVTVGYKVREQNKIP